MRRAHDSITVAVVITSYTDSVMSLNTNTASKNPVLHDKAFQTFSGFNSQVLGVQIHFFEVSGFIVPVSNASTHHLERNRFSRWKSSLTSVQVQQQDQKMPEPCKSHQNFYTWSDELVAAVLALWRPMLFELRPLKDSRDPHLSNTLLILSCHPTGSGSLFGSA